MLVIHSVYVISLAHLLSVYLHNIRLFQYVIRYIDDFQVWLNGNKCYAIIFVNEILDIIRTMETAKMTFGLVVNNVMSGYLFGPQVHR